MRDNQDQPQPDWSLNPEAKAWIARVAADLVPMIEGSAMTISLIPEGEADIKFAVELGLSIMMDKPILAVVPEGVVLTGKMRDVADWIIQADMDTPEGREKMQEALTLAVTTLALRDAHQVVEPKE